jgi:DNA invertase Pin-like site-specific DNA recombinase
MTTYPIPAARYLRMSTEDQQYSIANQSARIEQYAEEHGFNVIKTYEDPGKSGVVLKHRKGLSALLQDVISGQAEYKAILVYDVSRWGRFQNPDEAAHYEFLCESAGIPLHYCAEQFRNDGTASSSLVKAIKRSMAAEFSRELGEKVFCGKARLAEMGFWMGGNPGYAYRRFMISGDGRPKQLLHPGEQKSLTTDRVILVPGPREERRIIRLVFQMAASGKGPTLIARELNRSGSKIKGRLWKHQIVRAILENPKYKGCNIWNRYSERLHGPVFKNAREIWVTKPHAFSPIIDDDLFRRARAGLPVLRKWSKEEILRKVRPLLRERGRISADIIKAIPGMPVPATVTHYFGSFQQFYKALGYRQDAEDIFKGEQSERSRQVRKRLIAKIEKMFPEHVIVTHLPRSSRSILLIDHSFFVSIILCTPKLRNDRLCWKIQRVLPECEYVTLLCTLNRSHSRVLDYFVLPEFIKFRRECENDSWFKKGIRLQRLSDFYATVKKVSAEHSSQPNLDSYVRSL